ncbi:MAG: diaminopimelate epimerase [Oceanospirillaceae bacterium]|jgi:diaminopimelate epimerase
MSTQSWQEMCPQGRPFIKMQGLHNHFVIVDARAIPYHPTVAQTVQICDVKTGVGGDQLLVIEQPTASGKAAGAVAFMRIINVDGADAQACGNASRCIAWLLMEETGSDALSFETVAGVLACKRTGELEVSVEMGLISMNGADIPLAVGADSMNLTLESGPLKNPIALNIGNPHAICFVDDLDAVDMLKWAPAMQCDPVFPEKANVGAVQMLSPEHLRLSVYERPGILTTACGSGACVSVVAARAKGLTDARKVKVEMPAGSVVIEILEDNSAIMTGPVSWCYQGYLPKFC